MKRLFILIMVVSVIACTGKHHQPTINGSFLNGTWTYRSMLNVTNVNADFDSLAFAAATMVLTSKENDPLVTGQIFWQNDSVNAKGDTIMYKQGLNIKGRYFYNDTTTCFFLEGFGADSLATTGWQYNYQGYVVPKWPEGINQASTLVGSVVRVKKHSCNAQGDSCHPAGVTASIYLVKN